MTARVRRAVRVDPGATPGWRASADGKGSSSGDTLLHVVRLGWDRESTTESPKKGSEPPILPSRSSPSNPRPAGGHPQLRVLDPYLVLSKLERHRGTFEVLLRLYRHGPAGRYRLRCELKPGQRALNAALRNLEEMGLVASTREPAFPFVETYGLTTLGRQLLEIPLPSWIALLEV